MIITKRRLSRRTVLRGIGATVALPLLDAMVPAMTALRADGREAACMRFGAVYVPNGVIPGAVVSRPPKAPAFEFTPTLKPLEPFRDRLLVVSGLDSVPPPPPGERQFNNHADASTRFLTDVTPSRAVRAGVSIDQIDRQGERAGHGVAVARARARVGGFGSDPATSAAAASTPAPFRGPARRRRCRWSTIPSAAFERLFGDSATTDAGARRARMREQKGSILDSLVSEVAQPARPASAPRSVEDLRLSRERARRRAPHSERAIAHNAEVPSFDRPAGSPRTFEQHAQADVRPAVLAYPGRRDARRHVHDRPRVQRPHLSGDRRARRASSDLASPARSRCAWRSARRSTTTTCRCSRSSSTR